MKKIGELLVNVLGIYAAFLLAGLLQERVYHSSFNYPEFLVLCQYLVSLVAARAASRVFRYKHSQHFSLLKLSHAGISAVSILLTNSALTYVSYPTQALAKSCKVLPVMMGGLFVKHHNYTYLQYLSVLFVTVGVVSFNLLEAKSEGVDTLFGLYLLSLALLADGFSSYFIESIRREMNPSGLEIMDYCNLYGLLVVVPIFIYSEANRPLHVGHYIAMHPTVMVDILSYCIFSSLGQIFIFRVISNYGALTLAIVTTTRKFFAVLLSIFVFSHILSLVQWGCFALVLLGSSLDFYTQLTTPKSKANVWKV